MSTPPDPVDACGDQAARGLRRCGIAAAVSGAVLGGVALAGSAGMLAPLPAAVLALLAGTAQAAALALAWRAGAGLHAQARDARLRCEALAAQVDTLQRQTQASIEHLRADLALQRQRSLAGDAVFDTAPVITLVLDPDGGIARANHAARALLGLSADDPLPAPGFATLLGPADQAPFAAAVDQLVCGAVQQAAVHAELQVAGGRTQPVQLSLARLPAPGAPRLLLQVLDLTEQFEIERLKHEFVATVSHELRTPLTSIIGAIGLVKARFAEQIPPKGNELIDVAERNAGRLLRLINDLLDIDRILAGKMVANLRPHAVGEMLRELISSAMPLAQKHGVRLAIEGVVDDTEVQVDAHRLSQVLMHLVSNAAKFSPRGETVCLQLTPLAGQFEFAVVDRGPGIPEAFQANVFMKFRQADASVTRSKGGSGLGLALAKDLTVLMHGEIGFETRVGAGSRFWVRVPLAASAAAAQPLEPVPPACLPANAATPAAGPLSR